MTLADYNVGEKVGRGGHSFVFKSTRRATGEVVALKKVNRFKPHVQRELGVLQHLGTGAHPNVVRFIEAFIEGPNMYFVFEYLPVDMGTVLAASKGLTEPQACGCLRQVLQGLDHLHSRGILHRDIKPSNLLVLLQPNNEVGLLKITDFGVAMTPDPTIPEPFLQEGTIWYQPPELLFGLQHALNIHHVDMWATGCLFAEFLMGQPPFQGDSQIAMLSAIFAVLGSPTEETWPGCTQLRCYLHFQCKAQGLADRLAEIRGQKCSQECLALLEAMLQCDPQQRISPQQALHHPFFDLPADPVVYTPKPPVAPRAGGFMAQSPGRLPKMLSLHEPAVVVPRVLEF